MDILQKNRRDIATLLDIMRKIKRSKWRVSVGFKARF